MYSTRFLAGILFLCGATAAAAQGPSVNVDVSGVRNEIARNANVDPGQVPVSVQAPAQVAAKACGLDPKYFERQETTGGANCAAKASSAELEQLVRARLKPAASAGSSK